MSFLNNTDDEMNRYEEAAVLRQGATPSMITNMRSVFNTDTGKTDLLAPLPSGGFAKIASEAPQIMVESPAMPLAEPLPVDDSEIALQSIRDYQSGTTDKDGIFTPTQMSRDDYLAAGYTDQQIDASGITGQTQQKTGRSEPLSTEEITTILSNGESVFQSYDPTMRENGAANLTETLVNLRIDERREELIKQQIDPTEIDLIIASEQPEMLSLSENLADVVFGNRNVLGTGFADFATAGVMDMQEGWRMYTQALRTDSSLDRGLGILLMAAGAAEATGVGFLLGKTIKSAIPKVREGLQAMGASAQTRLTENGTGTTMMSSAGAAGNGKMSSKAQDAASKLSKLYGVDFDVSSHPTSFGNSTYVSGRVAGPDGTFVDVGFRLSDHATGDKRKGTDEFLTIIDDGEVTSETLAAEVRSQFDRALPKMQKMSDDREAKAISQADALSRWSQLSGDERGEISIKFKEIMPKYFNNVPWKNLTKQQKADFAARESLYKN